MKRRTVRITIHPVAEEVPFARRITVDTKGGSRLVLRTVDLLDCRGCSRLEVDLLDRCAGCGCEDRLKLEVHHEGRRVLCAACIAALAGVERGEAADGIPAREAASGVH